MLAFKRLCSALRVSQSMQRGGMVRSLIARGLSSESDAHLRVELLENDLKGIALFAINRPATRNAISRRLVNELNEGIQMVKQSREVRVVILKSDVPGMFCAGADLKERALMTEEEVALFTMGARRVIVDLAELPVPVISAIDGTALGGGLEVAMATDIRVAAENAKMGLVETRLAIIPGAGGTQRLPRLVGIGKAKEMIFTAKVIGGQEALEIGLVEHVVEQNDNSNAAYLKALDIAKEIQSKGPVAIKVAKKAIDNGMQTDLNTGMKVEEACYAQIIPTEDRMEALKAFKEKRTPIFKGK